MMDGQVVESGSHDALVAEGGMYADSWRAQTTVRRIADAPDDGTCPNGAAPEPNAGSSVPLSS
jgi:ATP-binding cassette subfamily B protein